MFAIDCGNTRIKWARFEAGSPVARGAASLADGEAAFAALAAALAQDAGRGPDIGRVLVANVAGDAIGSRIAALVRATLGRPAEFVAVQSAAHGIDCAYADPARLGVDRWLAMIAARRRADGPFVVVGAGTAVTFDAVDAGGRHLGGLILPGDRLMREALANGTGRIGRTEAAREPVAGLALLGRSTDEAVGRGARLALAAAVDRAYAVVARALAASPALLLTGGDADALLPWLETKAEVSADLVLDGLAAIADS